MSLPPGGALELALDLLRKDGLIVLALAALMWQVWFVAHDAATDRSATRAQLNDFIQLSRDSLEQRKLASSETATTIGVLTEAVRRLETTCLEMRKVK
jgi:hypothetical protein